MARPKKGTPEGDAANERWKETIIKNYGSVESFMKKAGRLGGMKGHTGGFAANKELASRVGRIGGSKSRRGPTILPKLKEKHNEIAHLHFAGYSVREIAEKLELPVASLYRYIRQYID